MNKNVASFIIFLFLIGMPSVIFGQSALDKSKVRGEKIFLQHCVTCHMVTGEGITGAFPPLAKSDYLMADKMRAAEIIINGLNGELKVNNVTYYGTMMAIKLSDNEIADVLNYVRNSWGNSGEIVLPEEVLEVR
ncbi:cytochrome c [Formosa sp. PL04]|uniref:c-type cytochrome n=1 Tax=Formosa sp. PL04 TaxID=3081755 RepID=UPI002981291C|nr:cytochrome c [Formosa sp. PL04]MDW5288061.1 cytochrome c [Formosa sp. PL04]